MNTYPNLAAERWRELYEQQERELDRLRNTLELVAALAYPNRDGSEGEYMAWLAKAALDAEEATA